jgi:hypothetical protein
MKRYSCRWSRSASGDKETKSLLKLKVTLAALKLNILAEELIVAHIFNK